MNPNRTPSPPRRDLRTRTDLPAWYHRIVSLEATKDDGIDPEDFDQDISELGEGEEEDTEYPDSQGIPCECDSGHDCKCELVDADNGESEPLYTGPDAEHYYSLKDWRIERKMDIRDEKIRCQEQRAFIRELESKNEQRGYAAYEAMLEAEKGGNGTCPRLESISGKTFDLHSVHHVDYCYNDFLYPTKYVGFYCHADDQSGHPPDENAEISGHIYMDADAGCNFLPFCPPRNAGSQKMALKVYGSNEKLVFQFINDKYLILTIRSNSKMFRRDIRKSADMPDIFKFVGIHRDLEERKRTMKEWQSRRPSSPGRTYFEMNHPMGAWNI
jgi:hypothetical protein